MHNGKLAKSGAKWILWLIVLSLLGFTTTRTLHFLTQTFPPDQQYIAYLALVAFDLGVLGWLYFATKAAEGVQQRCVAYGMIAVCCLGVILTTAADMVMVSANNGLITMPDNIGMVALLITIGVITLNVIAGVLVHIFDPSHQRHMAEESARDRIHATTLKRIEAKSAQIADQIAEQIAEDWVRTTITEMTGMLPRGKEVKQLAPASLAQTDEIEVPVSDDASKKKAK